jgi:sigma-E factor negative regulatory protein RseA
MDTNRKLREHISAFKDGELPEADVELALAAMHGSDGQAAWALYHLIGDTLRQTDGAGAATVPLPGLSPGFGARLAERLAAEPLPVRRPSVSSEPAGLAAVLAKSASS